MTISTKMQACLLAGALVLSPAAAVAQNSTSAVDTAAADTAAADAMAADTMTNDMTMAPVEREDNDFPWGLLGLLGLAGLLGRKRQEDTHVHVDRTTNGPTNNKM